MPNIKSPFGATDVFVLAPTGTTSLNIINGQTLIDGATTQLTAAATINLTFNTLDTRLSIGAEILLKVATTGITTVTFGTGFIAPVLTGVTGKTFSVSFYYDGVNFLPKSAPYQIN